MSHFNWDKSKGKVGHFQWDGGSIIYDESCNITIKEHHQSCWASKKNMLMHKNCYLHIIKNRPLQYIYI